MPVSEPTRFVLVRHGETEWNRAERFRGRVDVPLNETGHGQAQAVARRLASWPLEAVYSSPLNRALDTAQPIAAACGLDLSVLDALIDVDYGDWAGLSAEEAEARDPNLFATWRDNPHLVHFPRGESLEQVRQRSWEAVEALCGAHPGETVALVSHVVVNRVLISAALGLGGDGFWRIGQDNTAISVLEALAGRYRLLLLNDICHLEKVGPKKPGSEGQTST
jgi:broad specificity phosphatase PhoE